MERQNALTGKVRHLALVGLMVASTAVPAIAQANATASLTATQPAIAPRNHTPVSPTLLAQANSPTWRDGSFTTITYTQQVGGHRSPVREVAFSPDGQFLATAGADNTIKIWNLRQRVDRALVHTLRLERSDLEVDSLAFSPDGRTLASGSFNGTVRLWDWRRGQLLQTWSGHSQVVKSLAFTSNGLVLASGSLDGYILLRDVSNGARRQTIEAKQGIEAIAFSPDGLTLAGGGIAKKVSLWDWQRNRLIRELGPYIRPIYSLAFSPDGRSLIFSPDSQSFAGPRPADQQDQYNTIRFWDMRGRQEGSPLLGHFDYVVSMSSSPYGQLITGSLDLSFKIWDVQNRRMIRDFRENLGGILSVNFRSDGRAFAIGSRDGAVKVYISR